MEALIINLLGGAVGGNLAGAALKNLSLGTLWNSVVGILGGGLGGQLLSMLGVFVGGGGSAMDLGNIIGNVASSGVGGAVLLAIVGFIRNMNKK
ncbi:MAG TPA: hypothetical protein PKV71_10455 [Calditrichia bacterium]|nr:hypothetical protein [Calditrichota bacterium]HQV32289.1 hypothetical protein [Calditrichia bacterium]